MNRKDNYLDYVFRKNDDLTWTDSESGEIIVEMENKGFANRVAQLFFKRPARSHITLEGMGSFIWTCIDGKRTVYDIGALLHDKYGDAAEPLYERLSVYMKHLEQIGFIKKITSKTSQLPC